MNGGGATRLARGVLAGAVAWWVMDETLQFLYNREDPRVREKESQARNGIPGLEVLADRMAGLIGTTLSDEERQRGGTILQWATGIGTGMLYAGVRSRLPGSGIPRGLAYGAGFSLVVDEGIVPLLGLSPGPFAFPRQTHARGFVGHLVFGTVAEVTLQWLDQVDVQ